MQGYLISHHLHIALVDGFVLVESVLVVDSQMYLLSHNLRQLISQIIQHPPQSVGFSVVHCETVVHVRPQRSQVRFVQLAYFYLHQLDFSLVVLDQLLHLDLQLLVVRPDILQSDLFIHFQLFVQVDQSLYLLLFGLDHLLQTVNVTLEEGDQTLLLVGCVVPEILDLLLIECCHLLDSAPVSVVVLLHLQSQLRFLSNNVAQLCLVLLASFLRLPVQILYFCPLLLQLIGESLHFGLVQVPQLLLVLLVRSDQVVFSVLVLRPDEIQLVRLLVFYFLYLVLQVPDLAIQSLVLEFGFSPQILDFVVLLVDFRSQLLDVQLLQLVVSILRPFQVLDLVHGLAFVLVLQRTNLDLLQILQILLLVVQPADLGQQFVDLHLMLLVLDVQVIEYSLLLGLGDIRIVVLPLESGLPRLHLRLLLLDKFDQALVLVDQVGVLGQQHLDFLLQLVHPVQFASQEQNLLIQSVHFALQCAGSRPPIFLASFLNVLYWASPHKR